MVDLFRSFLKVLIYMRKDRVEVVVLDWIKWVFSFLRVVFFR